MLEKVSLRRLAINIIRVIEGIISFFLAFRIIFLLIPVNPSTPFVVWIYTVSTSLMVPFRGIVNNTLVGIGGVFDWVALITLIAYLVLGEIIVTSIRSLIPVEDDYLGREAGTYHSVRRR
jgi:hypothetical protein